MTYLDFFFWTNFGLTQMKAPLDCVFLSLTILGLLVMQAGTGTLYFSVGFLLRIEGLTTLKSSCIIL